ncbi:MAG: TIM barrel protein [Candidatus Aminicenantes bacterium]|jgi:sugar phosphate isomerase/epimerase
MKTLKIGIDNYGLEPLQLNPLEILEWAKNNGAEGVQFSGLTDEQRKDIDDKYLKDLAQFSASNDLYLEWGGGQHIPFDLETWKKNSTRKINQAAAKEAAALGTRIIRSCSGGLMRWNSESPPTQTLLKEMAKSLKSQRQMLKDHDVILAIETHFEFTTHELLRLFDTCDAEPGDYLGICLDTMNLLTMLEDPVSATERILPWVVSTHIKDGAILLTSEGFATFPAEIGKGIIDFQKILGGLASLPQEVNLSIEDHGGRFHLPIFDFDFLSRFPDLTVPEFSRLIQLSQQTEELFRTDQLDITAREEWSHVCDARLTRDIQTLKELLHDNPINQ